MKFINRISHIEAVLVLFLIYGFCMNCSSLQSAEPSPQKNVKKENSLSEKDRVFIEKIKNLCKAIDEERFSRKETDNKAVQQQLIEKIDLLSASISENTEPENAKNWKIYLGLDDLAKELKQDRPNGEIIKKSLASFESGANGLDNPMFSEVRKDLKDLAYDRIKYTKQEKEDFKVIRDNLPSDIQSLLKKYDNNLAELTAISLSYLKEHGAKKELYEELKKIILDRFSAPNAILSASDRLFSENDFSQNFDVNEMIRGSWVRGSGITEGSTTMKFVPNDDIAEIQLQLDADVSTKTVSSQKEVYVHSVSQGKVYGTKKLHFEKYFWSDPASASAQMDSTISGISSSRIFGWGIIQQRVAEEFPYSTAESKLRMENRFAKQMDEGFDKQIVSVHENLDKKLYGFLNSIDFMPRSIRTSTTDKNLFWKSNFSVKEQLAVPRGTVQEKKFAPVYDLSYALHESSPNNLSYNMYSGKKISDQQIAEQFTSFFGNAKKAEKSTDEPLWLFFAEDLPVQTKFDKDEIAIQIRLDGFEKDKKMYPELTVNIAYKIEKNEKGFVLRRKTLDALPGNIHPGQTIPARYQVIRSLLLKKLEECLKKEYAVSAIRPADNAKTGENMEKEGQTSNRLTGTLVPARFTAQKGWLELEYRYEPDPNIIKPAKKIQLKENAVPGKCDPDVDLTNTDQGLNCSL
ncbi:MAG: hypothetical protein Q4G69_01465 [Planctomycetia bacterium]|nr:hypothetical protein [Planctomycetia bacterium]